MKIAYLVNCYPKASHSFIRREIRALEELGIEVVRVSVRPPARDLVDPRDRDEATARMRSALDGFAIEGVATLLPFHRALLASPQWAAGETCADLTSDRRWLRATAETAADLRKNKVLQ